MICGRKVKLPSPEKGDGSGGRYLEISFSDYPHLPVPHFPFTGAGFSVDGLVAFISFFIPIPPLLHLPVLHFPLSHFIMGASLFALLHFAFASVRVRANAPVIMSPN